MKKRRAIYTLKELKALPIEELLRLKDLYNGKAAKKTNNTKCRKQYRDVAERIDKILRG